MPHGPERRRLAALIERLGYAVAEVDPKGSAAVDLLAGRDGPLCILSDEWLDRWAGALQRGSRAEGARGRIAVVLGADDPARARDALRLGARAIFRAPAAPNDVARWLLEAGSGRAGRTLRGFSPINVLQMVQAEGRSCLVELGLPHGPCGCFVVVDGRVREAVLDARHGREAALAMAAWDAPEIGIHPPVSVTWPTDVDLDLVSLALESAWLRDEGLREPGRAEELGPALSAVAACEAGPPDPRESAHAAFEAAELELSDRDLERLSRITDLVRDGSIEIPVMPSTYVHLLELVRNPAVEIGEISATVGRDQALSLKVLRLANSPLLATRSQTDSVHQAIVRLGLRRTRSLIFAATVETMLVRDDERLQALWRESLACARSCALLAPCMGQDPDEAFLAGVLHLVHEVLVVQALRSRGDRCQGADDRRVLGHLARVFFERSFQSIASAWHLPQSLMASVADVVRGRPGSVLYFARRVLDLAIRLESGGVDWELLGELYDLAARHGVSTPELDACLSATAAAYRECEALAAGTAR